MTYHPPHEVRDTEKLQSMIDALEAGQELPPIVVTGDFAITGSHRIEAWYQAGQRPRVVEISDAEYAEAMEYLDLDPIWDEADHNELCEALYEITDRPELKAALADQRGR